LKAARWDAVQMQRVGSVFPAALPVQVAAVDSAVSDDFIQRHDAAPGQRFSELLKGVSHLSASRITRPAKRNET
jgi:hypothetical protein